MADRFRDVRQVIHNAIQEGLIPGAVAQIGRMDEVLWQDHEGEAQVLAQHRSMEADTIFDLASLTKVVATLPAVLLLMQEGNIALSSPLSHYFPAFQSGMKSQVRIFHLLTHTAGLISHQPFYRLTKDSQEIIKMAADEPLVFEPGEKVSYSDLGFILLGALVSKITGEDLATFCTSRIFEPMGMTKTRFIPSDPSGNFAATEFNDNRVLSGVVHDENARAMGGIAGHAGLFAPAEDLVPYLAMWTGEKGVLGEIVKETAIKCQTPGRNGNRGWGFVLRGDSYDIAGDLWPSTTASHTGFTGTSLVFDRPSGYWAVLLTNRVHFGRQVDIQDFRRRFHNAAAVALFG